jgi:protein-tyrosine phosphatase
MRVLLVCFANTCRSPVAEALLVRALAHEDVEVASRGLAGGSGATPPALATALAAAGLQLGDDSGTVLERDDARSADLLLFMERRLLRDAVVNDPVLWPRSFTLREFARRALEHPPRPDQGDFTQWLAALHAGRRREDLLGSDGLDDVADPGLGGDEAQFVDMIDQLNDVVGRVAPFLMGWSASAG